MNSEKASKKFYNYLKIYRQEAYDAFFYGAFQALDETNTVRYTKALKQLDKEYTIANNFISLFENFHQDTGKIFLDFHILSDLLAKAKLNAKECTSIIFLLVQKNIQENILERDTIFVDINTIKKYQFRTMDNEEAYSLIMDRKIKNLIGQTEKDSILKKKVDEIFSFSEKHAPDISQFKESNAIIFSSYFEKQNTYDEQDIKNILLALENMGVSEKMLKYVEITLEKDYQKRKKVEGKNKISFEKVEYKKKYLTDEEYKKIRKELGKYYNLYQNKILKELTNEEMIYCLSLLYQLGVEEIDIDNFLLRYHFVNPNQRPTNSIQDFMQQLEKINYYQDKEEIKQIKNNLLEYMSDIFIVDDEEYLWVKEEIKNEMDKVYHLLNKNYQYEKSKAKKLSKKSLNL